MLRVLACVTNDHDWRLVVLAALVCITACFVAVNLASRTRQTAGNARIGWLCVAALVTGSGIWATHFVAMLAFKPHFPVAYETGLTLASIVVAVIITGIGFAICTMERGANMPRVLIGGAVFGIGVFAMHFTGMAAVAVPGSLTHATSYVVAALMIGVLFGAAGFACAFAVEHRFAQVGGTLLLVLSICGLHFTAMASVSIIPDPTILVAKQAVSTEWLAAGIVGTTMIILVAGLAGAWADRRVAVVSAREAQRLRATVAELEATKRHLELMTDQLTRALEEAAASSQTKSQFLAMMSHEIRTPMNAVIGMLALLQQTALDRKQSSYVRIIRESAESLLAILNDILDHSKLNARKLNLESISFSLEEVFRSVIALMEHRAAEKNVHLRLDHSTTLPQWVTGDPVRLRQIITNLVGNAIKFTEKGEVVVRARAAEEPSERVLLRVEVEDTGIGIPEAAQPALFSRFSQADSSMTRRYGGTGLGLAICRQLVELMDGRIGVESEEGRGSLFWLEIPLRLSERHEMRACPAVPVAGVSTALRPDLRVLVAEDNRVNQMVIAGILGSTGVHTTFAWNGAEAVAAVRSGGFDIVLMDGHMPEMDGIAATAAIRALPGPEAQIPIVALTANALAGDRETYLQAGMNAYVSKPIDIAELLAAIARLTGGEVGDRAGLDAASPAQDDETSPEAMRQLADLLASMDAIAPASKNAA